MARQYDAVTIVLDRLDAKSARRLTLGRGCPGLERHVEDRRARAELDGRQDVLLEACAVGGEQEHLDLQARSAAAAMRRGWQGTSPGTPALT